jgi:PEP-CTERM motif-containing protein
MADGGSTATINPGNGSGNIGMNNWSVLGQNQLDQQWFWYSINGSAAQPINNIGGMSVAQNGLNGNDLTLGYANSQLSASIEYVLSGNGAGSGSADLQEYISVMNPVGSGQSISLSFYQYSNFNLLGNSQNTVTIAGSPLNPGNPFSGFTGAQQTTGGPGGNGLAEVIDAPYANAAEAATLGQTLSELNSASYYTLNNNTSAGPGDVTWAFQWNETLNPGDTLNITKDKGLSIQIIPEPSTLAFIALGVSALGLSMRRKLS